MAGVFAEFFGLSKGCCSSPGNSDADTVLVVDTAALAEEVEDVKTFPSSKLEDGKTPTTTCGLSFGDPSPSSWGASPTSPGDEDFGFSKTGSALAEGASAEFEAQQLPELPDKAPLEEDQIVVSGLKARMQKARGNLDALRERVQVEILQGRPPSSPAEERELGFYSTSTLMRYLCMQDGDVNKAFKAMRDTMEWRKKTFIPALFPQGCSLPCCRACARDPLSHCFLCVGKDVLGRHCRLQSWSLLEHTVSYTLARADPDWLGSSAFVHMSLAAVLVWGFASIAGSGGLTDWIRDLGGFVSRKVKLKADGHGGRGLFVTADVDEAETLVSVPLQAMVLGEQATNATPCAGAIRRFFDQSPSQADRGRTHALFSMMVLLLSISDGDGRAEWPHLDDLLNHWSKGQQQRFPLLWPNWALREIEGTTASLVYAIARGGVEREYSELLQQTCPEIAGKFNLRAYKKVWALVNSRVLTYPGSSFAQPQPALVPLFDLVNHRLPVPVVPLLSLPEIQSHQAKSLGRFGTEPENGHLQLFLRRPLRELREATEVTDVYGLQSNEESLWTFGFTVPWIHNLTCLTRSRLTLRPEDLPYVSLSRPGFGWALSSSDLLRALEPHLSFIVGGCAAQIGPSGESGERASEWGGSLQPLLAFLRAWIASTQAESFADLRQACALTVPRPLQPVLRLPDIPGLFQETWSMGPCRYLNPDDERLLLDFLLGVLEEKRSEMAGGSLLDEERLLQRKGKAGVWQDAVVLRRDEKFLLQELTDWLSRERRQLQPERRKRVIYSCTGRAANKTPEDGIEHMATELERLFKNSTIPGSVAWIVDFAGFGFADCNPKIGALAFPMFASHYPERFGQIVCLSLPYAFYPIYAAGSKIFDKETMAKVKILKGDKDWKRYGDAYWSHDPGMRRWLDAAVKCKGVPGGFPDAQFTQDLQPRAQAADGSHRSFNQAETAQGFWNGAPPCRKSTDQEKPVSSSRSQSDVSLSKPEELIFVSIVWSVIFVLERSVLFMLRAASCLSKPYLGRSTHVSSFNWRKVRFQRPRYCSFTVHFIKDEGGSVAVKAKSGQTLLQVAHDHDIDIEGACGGECACSTCHIILEKEQFDKLPPPDDDETLRTGPNPSTSDMHCSVCVVSMLLAMATDQTTPRIAIFNMEIVGTVNPVLPVIAELAKRGCDVRYYLTKDTYVADVKGAGASPVKFDEYFLRWDALMEEEAGWFQAHGCGKGLAALTADGMEKEFLAFRWLHFALPTGVVLGRRLADLWSKEGSWRPDLVLYNVMLLHPYLAACKIGVPGVSFSTYPGPGTPMHLYEIPEEDRQAVDENLAKHPGMQEVNQVALRLFGVDVCASQLQCRFYSRQLNIMFSVPQLQGKVPMYQQALLDDSTFLWVGAVDDMKASANRASAPNEDRCSSATKAAWHAPPGVKVVVVSLGSLTVDMRWESAEHVSSLGRFTGREVSDRLWSELIETFKDRPDLRVVMSIGPRADARNMLGELPSNFVAEEYIDQVQALRHADVFVTHGGCNSIKEAAVVGVPMVVVPFCVDQPSNGFAIERAGAGKCFPDPLATPRGAIADAVMAALGSEAEEQRRCSHLLGEALRKAGGAPAVAKACLNLLRPASADMLDLAQDVTDTSRLGCQVFLDKERDDGALAVVSLILGHSGRCKVSLRPFCPGVQTTGWAEEELVQNAWKELCAQELGIPAELLCPAGSGPRLQGAQSSSSPRWCWKRAFYDLDIAPGKNALRSSSEDYQFLPSLYGESASAPEGVQFLQDADGRVVRCHLRPGFIGRDRCVVAQLPLPAVPSATVLPYTCEQTDGCHWRVAYRSASYYEVTVGGAGAVGACGRGRDREEAVLHCISVGLCTPRFSRYAVAKQQAGWDGESWGLHSDDGQLFHASNRGYQFADAKVAGPLTFGATGDVIGCGICQLPASFGDGEASHVTGGLRLLAQAKRKIFYTLNGAFLGGTADALFCFEVSGETIFVCTASLLVDRSACRSQFALWLVAGFS
ncbi:oleD [Symbiodinium sp. CCMP2592]|nr:oleD [Symbiodinium sp. CCMP2592]